MKDMQKNFSFRERRSSKLILVFLCLFAGRSLAGTPSVNTEVASSDTSSVGIDAVIPETTPGFVPTEEVFLKVNLPATRLDLYVNGSLYKSYPIAIGMPRYPTPIQQYTISQIQWNPWWLPPPDSPWAKGAKPTPPGNGNPLGPVKMLMEDGVRIHGTSAPGSIGHAASHACLRMKSEQASELAWEIQKRYSSKNAPELLTKYQRNRSSTFYVNLEKTVSVSVDYHQAELRDNKLIISPDLYGRGGLQKELEVLLAEQGIKVDSFFMKQLNRKRNRWKIKEFSLEEVRAFQNPAVTTNAVVNN